MNDFSPKVKGLHAVQVRTESKVNFVNMEEKKGKWQMITADSTMAVLDYLTENGIKPEEVKLLELAERGKECKCVYYEY